MDVGMLQALQVPDADEWWGGDGEDLGIVYFGGKGKKGKSKTGFNGKVNGMRFFRCGELGHGIGDC